MSVQDLVDAIVSFVKVHEAWAMPVAFLVAFAESFCFVSILWPGTTILAAITALLAASGASDTLLIPMILSAGIGGTVGYALSYWIGLYFKDTIPNIWPFKTRPELITRGEKFFHEWGAWGVFLGHFIGPVRAVIPVVAGMFRMPQLPFQVANVVSAFIWAGGVVAPSFFAGLFRNEIIAFINEHQLIACGALALFAFANVIPRPLFAAPTLVLFILLGWALVYGIDDPYLVIAAGAAGAFAGDLTGYWRGATRGVEHLHTAFGNGWSAEAAEDALQFMSATGLRGLILSKFHTTRRSFAPLAAGKLGFALMPFAAISAISGLLWSVVLLLPMFLLKAFVLG
jgi:membrane protein DedA with SNARE-associated domain